MHNHHHRLNSNHPKANLIFFLLCVSNHVHCVYTFPHLTRGLCDVYVIHPLLMKNCVGEGGGVRFTTPTIRGAPKICPYRLIVSSYSISTRNAISKHVAAIYVLILLLNSNS
jgi:hypothetical protein